MGRMMTIGWGGRRKLIGSMADRNVDSNFPGIFSKCNAVVLISYLPSYPNHCDSLSENLSIRS